MSYLVQTPVPRTPPPSSEHFPRCYSSRRHWSTRWARCLFRWRQRSDSRTGSRWPLTAVVRLPWRTPGTPFLSPGIKTKDNSGVDVVQPVNTRLLCCSERWAVVGQRWRTLKWAVIYLQVKKNWNMMHRPGRFLPFLPGWVSPSRAVSSCLATLNVFAGCSHVSLLNGTWGSLRLRT